MAWTARGVREAAGQWELRSHRHTLGWLLKELVQQEYFQQALVQQVLAWAQKIRAQQDPAEVDEQSRTLAQRSRIASRY